MFLKHCLYSEKEGNKIETLERKVEEAFIPFRVEGNVRPRTGHEGPGAQEGGRSIVLLLILIEAIPV